MSRLFVLQPLGAILIIGLLAVAAGCRPARPAPAPDNSPTTTGNSPASTSATPAKAAPGEVVAKTDESPGDDDPATETSESATSVGDEIGSDGVEQHEASDEDLISAEVETETRPAAAAVPMPRFLVLTRDGPLVVEAEIRIDGQPLLLILDQLVDRVLRDADTDGDRHVSWDELSRNTEFLQRYLPSLPVDRYSDGQRIQFINQYDLNRDKRVDRFEVPRLLAQGQDVAEAFSLLSSNEHRDRNAYDAALLQLLDDDEDRRLSPAELAGTAAVIRSRDFDTDDVYQLTDLVPTTDDGGFYQGSAYAPAVGYRLGDNAKWNVIHNALRELYAFGGPLDASCFPLTPSLFAEMDRDSNARISETEFAWLNTMPAHVVVAVDYGGTRPDDTGARSAPQLRVASVDNALRAAIVARELPSGGVVLKLPTSRIVAGCRDASSDGRPMAAQAFQMRDTDQNGYLDEEEFGGAIAEVSFADADANADGKVFPAEFVQALAQFPSAVASQVHARLGHVPDAFFAAVDVDFDGRLAPREIDRAGERLAEYDRNGNRQIETNEVPDTIVVLLVRGTVQDANRLFAAPLAPGQTPRLDLPRWFAAMDQNADGDLSHREFLGNPRQFRQLDANQDGYIDGDEALQLTSEP